MSDEKIRVVRQIGQIAGKWMWGSDDTRTLWELYSRLGELAGYSSDEYDIDKYGMEELVRILGADGVRIVVKSAQKSGGTEWYQYAAEILSERGDAECMRGLRDLLRSGNQGEREEVQDAMRRNGVSL